jgi:valyl-tRNA synthetase
MKTEVSRAAFAGPAESLTRLRWVESDLRDVGRLVGDVSWTEQDGPVRVDVTLVEA